MPENHTSRPRRRGQANVIGAVLLFGLLMAVLVLVQMSAVPGWNQAEEIEHNERVHDDMQSLAAEIRDAAATGRAGTGVIELGVQYPTRPFLFNPPDPTGRLRTTAPQEFSIRNAEIDGVDNYWEPDSPEEGILSATTRQVLYDPNYNEYQTPPTTTIENGVVYNDFEQNVFLARQGFLDDRRITLTAVNGSLDRDGVGAASVAVTPESAPANSVGVRNRTDEPLELRLPTRLPESDWEELLADEFRRNGGHIVGDEDGVTVSDGTLSVTLEAGVEYDLRMARVGLGDRTTSSPARYVTHVSGGETALRPLQGERLTFEVRNRFNNPVAGETVELEASSGSLSQTSVRTGPEGRAAVQYTAPLNEGTETVTARVDVDGDGDWSESGERTTVQVAVSNGTTTGGDFASVNPGPGSGGVRVVGATDIGGGMNVTFQNDAGAEMRLAQFRLSYYYSDDTNPAPSSATYVYESFSQPISIPGEFIPVEGPTLSPVGTDTDTDTITITDLKNNVKDDFVVVNTIWVDPTGEGHRYSYIIAAE